MIAKENNTITFKLLLIGSSGVGKSSLLLKYIKNKFSYDYQVTTGVQFFTKNVKINEKTQIKLQIWDTVGQQAFKSVVRSFYKGVSAIILVYSIDRWQSFEQLTMWLKEIRQNAHSQSLIFLVGSKLDLQEIRKVSKEQANNYCKSIDAVSLTQVSSKTGQNVKELFEKMAKTIYKKYNNSQNFRELVRPTIVQDPSGKAQSFNLQFPISARNSARQSNCC